MVFIFVFGFNIFVLESDAVWEFSLVLHVCFLPWGNAE